MTRSDHLPRCAGCGEPIGVYEPALTVTDEQTLASSHTLRSELDPERVSHFHRACFPDEHAR